MIDPAVLAALDQKHSGKKEQLLSRLKTDPVYATRLILEMAYMESGLNKKTEEQVNENRLFSDIFELSMIGLLSIIGDIYEDQVGD